MLKNSDDCLSPHQKIQLVKQLTCPICKGIFRNAHTITECMHNFCQACLIKELSKFSDGGNYKCPLCKFEFGTNLNFQNFILENKLINQMIDILFPEFKKINEENKKRMYIEFAKYHQNLPGEEDFIANIGSLQIELKPLNNIDYQSKKLPSIKHCIAEVKKTCKIEAIKKFIYNQLPSNMVKNFQEIQIYFQGIPVGEKNSLEELRNQLKNSLSSAYKLSLFYSKILDE